MNSTEPPKIGILCWETGHVPRGLMQLESLVGNSTNPASYKYPVRLKPVLGANVHTVLEKPDRQVLARMITDAKDMASDGILAITTSCGFNAIFQEELATAVGLPVFTSSLLQVPFVQCMLGPASQICVVTANAGALRSEHLRAAGIAHTEGLHIAGLEQCTEWRRMFAEPDKDVALARIAQEVLRTCVQACAAHPAIRAFVLECTDLPPFSAEIRRQTGLPVFDFISMANYLHASL
ncbi:MAG: aspartate/glutamate racemase family protein [Rhodoferax sp.]|nr:aspartate/glutamate racemase family protein [Rhodoferax sp.]